ncbi:hypothetical protein L1D50_16540 [Pseudoalteromonas sp. Isolate6]|uniref:hypothetical protein n=1 Tax=Pseudoalteromonas sp. Isolate6 TaxID=2908527 RepID=UPI001EFCD3EE|nr:hypothetical protein [Pseudoalteromonas sp. Isolate6]MCG9760712.1 hypothetical protein [Pseudoalteromonas sp. Isolate6]
MKNQKNTQKSLSSADLANVVGGNGSGNNPIEYSKKNTVKSEAFNSVHRSLTTREISTVFGGSAGGGGGVEPPAAQSKTALSSTVSVIVRDNEG